MAAKELITTVIVGSGGAATIDFTSIPQTYTDLQIVLSGRLTTNDSTSLIRFNSSTTSYSSRYVWGLGNTTVYTGTDYTGIIVDTSTFTANTFGSTILYIPNYAGAANKTILVDGVSENNAVTAFQSISSIAWANTAAITSISFVPTTGSLAQYSTASLYGWTKGSGGATVA